MKVTLQILGPGCGRCQTLAQFAEQAAKDLGLDFKIEKITNLQQMVSLGVMGTPGLVVNGAVKVVGKVPSIAELKSILQETS